MRTPNAAHPDNPDNNDPIFVLMPILLIQTLYLYTDGMTQHGTL